MTDKLDELIANARVHVLQPDDVVVLEMPDAPLSQAAVATIRRRLTEAFRDRRAVIVNGRIRIESQSVDVDRVAAGIVSPSELRNR